MAKIRSLLVFVVCLVLLGSFSAYSRPAHAVTWHVSSFQPGNNKGVSGAIHAYDASVPGSPGVAAFVTVGFPNNVWIEAGIIKGPGTGDNAFNTGGLLKAYVGWNNPQGIYDFIHVEQLSPGTDHTFSIEEDQHVEGTWHVFVDGIEILGQNYGKQWPPFTGLSATGLVSAQRETQDNASPPQNRADGWFGELKYSSQAPMNWQTWTAGLGAGDPPYTYKYIEQSGHQEKGPSEPVMSPKPDEFFTSGPRTDKWGYFPAGWNMFSFPLKPEPQDWVTQLAAISPLSVYHYNPDTGSYAMHSAQNPNPFLPQVGQGYWVETSGDAAPRVYGFLAPDQAGETPSHYHDFAIELRAQGGSRWNQIGNPFPFAVNSSDLRVRNGGSTVTLEQAHNNGWISKYLLKYDTATRSYVRVALPPGQRMEPWTAYWVYARASVELLVPAKPYADPPPPGEINPPVMGVAELYGAVPAQGLSDNANYAVIDTSASTEFDLLDVPEPPPLPDPDSYLQLYFPHTGWAQEPGNYSQDARPENAIGSSITWDFEVKTSESDDVTLTWDVEDIPEYQSVQLQDGKFVVSFNDENMMRYVKALLADL